MNIEPNLQAELITWGFEATSSNIHEHFDQFNFGNLPATT